MTATARAATFRQQQAASLALFAGMMAEREEGATARAALRPNVTPAQALADLAAAIDAAR